MLTAKLILERVDKDGRLLERRERQSRSFLKQFIQFLYMAHIQTTAGSPYSMTDITGAARSVDNEGSGSWHYCKPNLGIAAPPGLTGIMYGSYSANADRWQQIIQGEKIGIQVGKGTTAPTPTDYKMEDRIPHGRTGKTGGPAAFNNPSFETGDLTGWTEAYSGNLRAGVASGVWTLKHGTYYCVFKSIVAFSAGDYAQISQDIDLTSITHFRFQLHRYGSASDFRFSVSVDGVEIYSKHLATSTTDYPDVLVDVNAYTGSHTVAFRTTALEAYSTTADWVWLDNVETLNLTELEYSGCELMDINFVNPNGEFRIRRYFTNRSGVSVTVNEVGIYSPGSQQLAAGYAWPFCIARDVVSPGITVLNGELLRVTYVPQISV